MCYLRDMDTIELRIRHIPEDVARRAKSEAALAGITLNDWIIAAMKAALERKAGRK